MRALGIWMNGLRVGRWEISRTGAHSLVYDPGWLASEHVRPLSLSLPFTPDLRVTGEVVENFFDNLLPDNTDNPSSPAASAPAAPKRNCRTMASTPNMVKRPVKSWMS